MAAPSETRGNLKLCILSSVMSPANPDELAFLVVGGDWHWNVDVLAANGTSSVGGIFDVFVLFTFVWINVIYPSELNVSGAGLTSDSLSG